MKCFGNTISILSTWFFPSLPPKLTHSFSKHWLRNHENFWDTVLNEVGTLLLGVLVASSDGDGRNRTTWEQLVSDFLSVAVMAHLAKSHSEVGRLIVVFRLQLLVREVGASTQAGTRRQACLLVHSAQKAKMVKVLSKERSGDLNAHTSPVFPPGLLKVP